MGLFSSVIHVRNANANSVCEVLTTAVPNWSFKLSKQRALVGRYEYGPEGALQYLVSPLQGRWSTILESHGYIENGPWLPELAKSLSAALQTHTLALMVHDDDVLFFNLCLNGDDLDGYNSNPQYFEAERLPDVRVLEQRHDPQPFLELLPDGVSLEEFQEILDRGWWSAYNGGRLDTDGVMSCDEPGFVFEGERMIAIGNLLQLHGQNKGYPFAGWADDKSIEWSTFHELHFQRT
jgi:hypothetical protein